MLEEISSSVCFGLCSPNIIFGVGPVVSLFDVDLTQLGEEGVEDWHGNDISYILLSSGLAHLQNVSSVPK